MGVELRTMRYFLAVAEERHFGRAAARSHVAQPALSQQIIQLEAQLGVRLFDRSTRRVEITQAGERFAEHAQRIVAAADRAGADMAAFADGRVGRVAVGFVGTATYDVLPRLAHRIHAELPGVDLRLRGELLSPPLVDGVRTGEYDLALVRRQNHVGARGRGGTGLVNVTGDTNVEFEVLRNERLLAVLPAGHRLADAASVELAALREEAFVVHPSGGHSSMYQDVLAACARAGFQPSDTVEVSETATMVVSVAAGLGVALAPEPVRTLGLDGVVYRPLVVSETIELLLARREAESSPAVLAVAARIRDAAGMPVRIGT